VSGSAVGLAKRGVYGVLSRPDEARGEWPNVYSEGGGVWIRILKLGFGFHSYIWRLLGCEGIDGRAIRRSGRLGGMSVGKWYGSVDCWLALFVLLLWFSFFKALVAR